MNKKIKEFLHNFSYTFTSNLLTLIISSLVVLIVPKFLGVEEYGYWQLYMLYAAYVGFFHFGWNDGLYLRYGGKRYEELDKNLFFSQFIMQLLLQVTIAIIIFLVSDIIVVELNKAFILRMFGLSIFLFNLKSMLLYILQSTNRLKEYAKVSMLGRLSFFIVIIVFLLLNTRSFKFLVYSDLIGKTLSLFLAMYYCRDIVFRKFSSFKFNFKETYENLHVGIKLMIANIASILIIGAIRFIVEYTWGIEEFGKVSFTLSISNLVMVFINTIGIVLYPTLRRINKENSRKVYIILKDSLGMLSLGLLLAYYPIKIILVQWLPQYTISLNYMILILPVVVYQAKIGLLTNTYFKSLRKEKTLLFINVGMVIFAIISSYIAAKILGDINLTLLCITLVVALKSIVSEIIITKDINVNISKDILYELVLSICFILLFWNIDSFLALLIYFMLYSLYFLLKKNELRSSYVLFKEFSKKEINELK